SSGEHPLIALAHLLARPGLQDWRVEITDGKHRLRARRADIIVRSHSLSGGDTHRSGTAWWRQQPDTGRHPPNGRIWREIGRRLRWRAECKTIRQCDRAQ